VQARAAVRDREVATPDNHLLPGTFGAGERFAVVYLIKTLYGSTLTPLGLHAR
jgi:hypothetical protein